MTQPRPLAAPRPESPAAPCPPARAKAGGSGVSPTSAGVWTEQAARAALLRRAARRRGYFRTAGCGAAWRKVAVLSTLRNLGEACDLSGHTEP